MIARSRAARRAVAAIALVALGLATPSAATRPRKKKSAAPSIRAEDDPQLAGEAKQFTQATVSFRAPQDGAEIAALGGVPIQLDVQGYALGSAPGAVGNDRGNGSSSMDVVALNTEIGMQRDGPGASEAARPDGPQTRSSTSTSTSTGTGTLASGTSSPFAILLVDNDGALRIDDASQPLRLTGLSPGPHALRVVLSRPWGEVVKAPGAFALTRFWMGPRPADESAARKAEANVWPDPKRPMLSYVFPLGELHRGLALYSDATADSPSPGDAGAPPSSGPASARPLPEPLALDFFLAGVPLKERGRGGKVRVVIDKRELPIVRAWRPLPLKLGPGRHRITIDLLDRRSTKVKNAGNRTDRFVVVPDAPAPAPTGSINDAEDAGADGGIPGR